MSTRPFLYMRLRQARMRLRSAQLELHWARCHPEFSNRSTIAWLEGVVCQMLDKLWLAQRYARRNPAK